MSRAMKPLEPTRVREVTLNDLIDRILEKGLLLNADLIIGVAGIPLLGVNLRLALAGMSTMLRYGFMRDWDEATRAWESAQRRGRKQEDLLLEKGERLVWSGFATHWYERGIYSSWRPGMMYLTDRRLVLLRREPHEVLLEVPYHEVEKLEVQRFTHCTGGEREELQLRLCSGELERVRTTEINRVMEHLSRRLGINVDSVRVKESVKLPARWFKVWYQTGGAMGSTWRPGVFYIKGGKLLWRAAQEDHWSFSLWPPDLLSCQLQREDLGSGLKNKPVLELRYLARHEPQKARFSGSEEVLSFWLETLQGLHGDELETCPGCGAPGPARRLLNDGCGGCGWLSPKKTAMVKAMCRTC